MKTDSYYGTGRRKSAVAKVWLFQGKQAMLINGRSAMGYLQNEQLCTIVNQPLKALNLLDQFRIRISVVGGGLAGQAGAIRMGISRALLKFDEKLRLALRQGGFLTRDPRKKERKKPGRKGARRSFQYTKR